MRDPLFNNLYDAAWALIGHELLASESLDQGMFAASTVSKMPDLETRIECFRNYAFRHYGRLT